MILSRSSFFIILFLLIVVPWFIPKTIWLINSKKAIGVMEFVGHDNLGSVLGMSTYPVVQFKVGDSVFHFNGNMNLSLQKGQSIEVRYQRNNPSDARINSLCTVWVDTFAYEAGPTLCWLVMLLSPGIIPWKSRVKIGRRTGIQILK